MARRIVFIVVIAAASAAGYSVYRSWFDPVRAVTRRLEELAATLSVTGHDGDVTRVARLAQLRGFFAPEVRIRAGSPDRTITSREELLGVLSAWTPPPDSEFKVVDVHVTVAPDTTTANAYLTVEMIGRDNATGQRTIDAAEVAVMLAMRDGQWVMTSAEAQDTLQRTSK
jgi:hypothetical protein